MNGLTDEWDLRSTFLSDFGPVYHDDNNYFLLTCIFQVLNVQGNKLKALPVAIGNLTSLQSLILQGLMFFQSHLFSLFAMSKDEWVIIISSPLMMLFFFNRK